jgi:hypothetical protein
MTLGAQQGCCKIGNKRGSKGRLPKSTRTVHRLLVTEAFAIHSTWQRPHQGISCGNRPPRVAFPTLPSLPSVPDLVNPDAWLSRVKGQHLVRRVNRQGFVKIDVYPYSISSKLDFATALLSSQPLLSGSLLCYSEKECLVHF